MVYKIALLKSYKANVKHFLKRKIIKGSYLHEVGKGLFYLKSLSD